MPLGQINRRFDEFEFNGHYCMVMDLLGSSLYDVLKESDYTPFPMAYIRPILKNVGVAAAGEE